MMVAARISALPCPNGCSLSAGRLEIHTLKTTMMEVMESDNVCQASAIMATEPDAIPAQYLKPNKIDIDQDGDPASPYSNFVLIRPHESAEKIAKGEGQVIEEKSKIGNHIHTWFPVQSNG